MALSPDPRMEIGDAKYEHELGLFSPIGNAFGQEGLQGVASFECEPAGAQAKRERGSRSTPTKGADRELAAAKVEAVSPKLNPGTRELGCGVDPGISTSQSPIQYFRADVINAQPHRLAVQPQLKPRYTGITQAGYQRALEQQSP